MAETTISSESSQTGMDIDSITIDPNNTRFKDEGEGNFTFTTKTQEEGRKIGYEIGTSVFKQRAGDDYREGEEESLLWKLKEYEKIEDYRLDGNQLSFSEEHDEQENVWIISIIQRYGNNSPDELNKLNKAVEELGFRNKK